MNEEEVKVSFAKRLTEEKNKMLMTALDSDLTPLAIQELENFQQFLAQPMISEDIKINPNEWMSNAEILTWGAIGASLITALVKTGKALGEEAAVEIAVPALRAYGEEFAKSYDEQEEDYALEVAAALLSYFFPAECKREQRLQDALMGVSIIYKSRIQMALRSKDEQ